MEIVLASGSPRRRELLRMLGVVFTVDPAAGEERVPDGAAPEDAVKALSLAKARETAGRHGQNCLTIGADTVVCLDGEILGKPKNAAEAEKMLLKLSGRVHRVYTGVSVILRDRALTHSEATDVFFRELCPGEVASYVKTGEPMDKAGAYGIQGRGSLFIERIEGDFYNVMGLPLCRLQKMLKKLGVNPI